VLTVKDGYCRLCWQQARYESKTAGGFPRGAVTVLDVGGVIRRHQLFFDRMKLRRPKSPTRKYDRRGAPRRPPPAPACRPAPGPVQLRLFDAARDVTRFDERNQTAPDNPWLVWAVSPTASAKRAGGAAGSVSPSGAG
jgi:hypothetical protein